MAKRKKKRPGKDGRTPRPTYDTAKGELDLLSDALKQIAKDKEDENGPLSDVQLAQVAAARTSVAVAKRALTCIQDQAPYRMKRK